jgi:hypothetical protein
MANITSKELSVIGDQLSAEQILVKKYNAYASMCSDPVLKQKFTQTAQKHQSHYDLIFSHLN